MEVLKMIEDLSNSYGAPGFEDDVLLVGRKYGSDLGEISEDSIRNLYIKRKQNTGGKPVVMLDAHSDEVAFMVQAITPQGTLRFVPLGGWVDHTIPAHKVKVRNADGKYISGVVASKPPHFMTEAERKQGITVSNMVIDIGASSKEEVEQVYKIKVAAPIVPDVSFEYDSKNEVMIGKAFDCRLGCASVLETMECLQDETLNVDVIGTFSTQEEMGCRGAQVTAQTIKPDIAIVFEGCPADDTFSEDYMIQTAIKKGPMLRHIDQRMITNPRFMRFALDIGEEFGIDIQEAVRSGGSTNGAPIHLSNQSVPVIVIGIPVRYIHTHYGIASMKDFQQGVQLAVEVIKRLDEKTIQGF